MLEFTGQPRTAGGRNSPSTAMSAVQGNKKEGYRDDAAAMHDLINGNPFSLLTAATLHETVREREPNFFREHAHVNDDKG